METQKPYLDEELTIGQLSMITNIPVHHLSIVINSVFGKNFSSFISEYRINEAISHMSSDPDANILSIAYRSGFNSKSAFNKTFKHITGKTPSQYRETVTVIR
jgi:AraC-like DNA-binding protein